MTAEQLTYDEAAEQLLVSTRWLSANLDRLPHLKFGPGRNARVFFLPEHIEQIRAMHEHQPIAEPAEVETPTLRPVPARVTRKQPVSSDASRPAGRRQTSPAGAGGLPETTRPKSA